MMVCTGNGSKNRAEIRFVLGINSRRNFLQLSI
jgi:hypothetical protein